MTKNAQTMDMQAATFGVAPNVASAFLAPIAKAGTISAGTTNPTVSCTGQTFTVDQYKGCMVLVSTNATFGTADTIQYGVIQSNTAGPPGVLTVDTWYTLAGAAGSSAASGLFYVILPVTAPFWYIALTDSTSAVTAGTGGTDTGSALGGSEITYLGLGRALVTTVTRTVGQATLTLAKTFTYTGGTSQAIGRCAITNSMVASKNFAYFIDQVNAGVAATVTANGDTFTPTYTITLG